MTARKGLLAAAASLMALASVFMVVVGSAAGSSARNRMTTAGTARAATAPPLVIAVEGPQSGSQASNGRDQLRGVRLAVRQLNRYGGLWNGRKVVIYAADDRGDAADAKAVARRVIARGIRFVIGPYNSSVGVENLAVYRRHHVLPVWMTSRPDTAGFGATAQPMNPQISPVEIRYVKRLGVRRVAMLVDETPNGAFTRSSANRLRRALTHAGISVTTTSVKETESRAYYVAKVRHALASHPGLIYVSTYFPEGAKIAGALLASGSRARCLMGLANVDVGFLEHTSLGQARRCTFSGIPAATEMASARAYVRQYREAFGHRAGVWGAFTYDSARILFRAIDAAQSLRPLAVERQLRDTSGFRGATGMITINRRNGYRRRVPVTILRVNVHQKFVPTG